MYYLILLGTFILLFGGLLAALFFLPRKQRPLMEKIFACVFAAIFAVRLMCFKDIQVYSSVYESGYFAIGGGPFEIKFFNYLGEFSIWFELTAMLIILMRPFFPYRLNRHMSKFIAMPILLIASASLKPMLMMLQGHDNFNLLTVMLPIELGGLTAFALYYFIKDFRLKIRKRVVLKMVLIFLAMNIATMPPYLPFFLFGPAWALFDVTDLEFFHRVFIYVGLLVWPFTFYFAMRNAHKDKIRYALIFVSLGTLIGFMAYNKYTIFTEPWTFPFHLCNTAMFLTPICLIFKRKRLFYFTYFINVFGAVLAMLMPNYVDSSTDIINMWDPVLIQYWYNHIMAATMPLLCVALKEYPRPKLKMYLTSIMWFFVYYVLVLVLNVSFSAFGHETDFFFINSDFIADKLGDWAENLFKITVSFNIQDKTFTFRPIYQLIYFFVYVLLGFAVWFVYELGFSIADSHYELHIKLKAIRADQLALQSSLNGRSLEEPMDKDAGTSLKLFKFSKKYATSKTYAVRNASFEVKGGEVFGFLGPNGAGKSTIIKSIVGIQPITEGSIEVCGYDVKKQPVFAKSQIGFVPDHYALYEKLTGREYLNYIADIYEVSKEDRDQRLGEYIKIFELESSIDNKIKTYSHGMKQKITIIAALVHNPKVWILDEPLTGLDPTSIYQVKECMRRHAAQGNIVFFSSHLIDIVEKLCDRIAIIKHGHIQCVEKVSDIEESGITLEEYYMQKIGDNSNKEKE